MDKSRVTHSLFLEVLLIAFSCHIFQIGVIRRVACILQLLYFCASDMSARGDHDDQEVRKTLRRLYKNEAVQSCSVCAELQLLEDDPASGLQDHLEDIVKAGQQGCSFCALVSRSARREQRVFNSLPWNQARRTITKEGCGVTVITNNFSSLPPRKLPLNCAHLDSVDPEGPLPLLDRCLDKAKSGRSGTLDKHILSTRDKDGL